MTVIVPFQLRSQGTERLITLTKDIKPAEDTWDLSDPSTKSSKEATSPRALGSNQFQCRRGQASRSLCCCSVAQSGIFETSGLNAVLHNL